MADVDDVKTAEFQMVRIPMNRRHLLWLGLATACTNGQTARVTTSEASQSRADEIRRILINRIDRDRQSRGIVVGVTTENGAEFVAYGKFDDENSQPVSTKTSFEIGSITKTFTALLLADAVHRKEVALSDPAAKYLPTGLKALERNGKPITLEHLATHMSGLPPWMVETAGQKMTMDEAYSNKPDDIFRFLSTYDLSRDPGSQFEYSNLGMALLGLVLARRTRQDYATLLSTRIVKPLGLSATGGPNLHAKDSSFAVGHDAQLNQAKAWGDLGGSGGLRSTAEDLIRFVNAAIGNRPSPLKPSFDALLSVRKPIGPDLDQALGWQVRSFPDQVIVNKGGNSFGFCAFVGFDLQRRIGVVVLSNSIVEIEDIGMHVLRAAYPLTEGHKVIPTDPSRLDGYVGRYAITPPPTTMLVLRQGDELFVELNGSPKFRLYREDDQRFFLKEIELSFEFQTGADGRATGFILRQKNIPDVVIPRVGDGLIRQ